MSQSEKFRDEINTGYSFKGDALLLGGINYQTTLVKKNRAITFLFNKMLS